VQVDELMKRAVVLLSGGLDSTITLAMAAAEGYDIYALSLDYGQRHEKELACAKKVADHYNVREHKVLYIDLPQIGGSALTDLRMAVPQKRGPTQIGDDIPITYVPARNMIMLSFAVAYAEVVGADAVFIGANALDYSGYPDCRPEFLKAFQDVARLGTKRGVEGRPVEIIYPLVSMTKAEIVKEGTRLNAPLHLTWSCYQGLEKACGRCDSCTLRLKGFREAGIEDPLEYAEGEDGQ
jgi:7-cyano-7-deazaguanine synthase